MSARDLRVLTYHRVVDPADARDCDPALISATPENFERQVRYLATHYHVVSAEQVVDASRTGRPLPLNPVWVTFDDACRDFGEVAWPILRRHGVPATVFVPTAYPDHPLLRFWWDRLYSAFTATTLGEVRDPDFGWLQLGTAVARRSSRRLVQRRVKAMPHSDAMLAVDRICGQLEGTTRRGGDTLSWGELRRLTSQGVSVGAHTRTHPALTRMSVEDARREIRGSRDDLQRELGAWLPVFAYPFGDHDDTVVGVVREEGFELAVTCDDGHNAPSADPLRLRRTNMTRRTRQLAFRARLTSLGARVDRWRHRHERTERPRSPAAAPGHPDGPPVKLAYIMSRFPKLSETFILNELATADTLGVPIEIYPLIRERQKTLHPGVEAWVRRARFQRLLSPGLLLAHVHYLARQPIEYVGLGAEVLRRTWGSPNFFIGALGTFPKAVRFAYDMQRDGVTHVHAHFATHPTVAAFIIHRLTGLPFSFTAHGSDLHVDRRMLDAKVDAAAFAVTVSNYNREVMVRTCGEHTRHKLHVIHCGVDPQYFVPVRRGASAGPLRLVCVASLETVKGHTYLIDACRILKGRGLDFRCSLAGDGPRRRALRLQVERAGLGDCVQLLGGQTRPQVVRLLADADVAVLASHPTREGKREGIPVALMEAMAAGLPVVSSAISGIPELVESEVTGLLVPSGDPLALASAIERLDADPVLRERMGRAGRLRICQDFNLETNTRQLLRLFSATPASERVGASAAVAPPLASCT